MRVSFLSENLKKKLLFINHAISTHGQLPILSNVLIEAKNGVTSINATDLEIGISINIPTKIEEEGKIAIPARTFSELISEMPIGKITLSTTKEGTELKGEKIKTKFQTAQTEDFPKLYEEKGEEITTIKRETVEEDLQKVVFAASTDSGRPALSGVLIKEEKGETTMVATDGYRLSLKKRGTSKTKKTKEATPLLVPSRIIKELILMEKDEEEIKVYGSMKNNQIIFLQNDTTLVGRLIEAEFPAYEKIIPLENKTKTSFDKEEMRKAVKTCYIFARETANIIKLDIQKEKIIVSSSTPGIGANTIELEAKTKGEEGQAAFNGRYLLDLFSNINEETMSFETNGPLNPGVFKIDKDETFLHLIMPIRVQGDTEGRSGF